jgi:DNA-directed RNA polymerase subunit N
MMIPIRCWSCGKPIAHLWEDFKERLEKEGEENRKQILDELGLERYCCRAIFLGHVDLIDTVSRFKKF